jgi:hypothetical protein
MQVIEIVAGAADQDNGGHGQSTITGIFLSSTSRGRQSGGPPDVPKELGKKLQSVLGNLHRQALAARFSKVCIVTQPCRKPAGLLSETARVT